MKTLIWIICLIITIGCNRELDLYQSYRIIKEKFPDDDFIWQSLDKAQQDDFLLFLKEFDVNLQKIENKKPDWRDVCWKSTYNFLYDRKIIIKEDEK